MSTQLERADAIHTQFKAMLPEIDRLTREMSIVLDEAQNLPPDGASDDTISETRFLRFRQINKCAASLALAVMFDSRSP